MRAENNNYLGFNVAGTKYATSVSDVKEIVYGCKIVPLSHAPEFVRGIAFIRDEVVPIIDMNLLLGGDKPIAIDDETCFIIARLETEHETFHIGIMPDEILQTYKFPSTDVDLVPALDGKPVVSYIDGFSRVDAQLFVIINVQNLLLPMLGSLRVMTREFAEQHGTEAEIKRNKAGETIKDLSGRKTNAKFLSVHYGGGEYAFPLSTVKQVIKRGDLTQTVDEDIPNIFYMATIIDNNIVGVIDLNHIVAEKIHPPDEDTQTAETKTNEDHRVVIIVEFRGNRLGVLVDRIGVTYERTGELKQNKFCLELDRERIRSLGFIETDTGSIEVIDPVGLLTGPEQEMVSSWSSCVGRIAGKSTKPDNRAQNIVSMDVNNERKRLAGQYLIIQIEDIFLGMPSKQVDEVLTFDTLIPVKNSASWLAGILDLRKHTYAVIDLKNKLDIEKAKEIVERQVIVMVKHNKAKVGFLVDKIVKNHRIDTNEIKDVSQSKLTVAPVCTLGMAEVQGETVHLVDIEEIIDKDLVSTREVIKKMNEQKIRSAEEKTYNRTQT